MYICIHVSRFQAGQEARFINKVHAPPFWPYSPLETTQGQIEGCFSQLLFKSYLPKVEYVGSWLQICPLVASRVERLVQSHRTREPGGLLFTPKLSDLNHTLSVSTSE